MEINDLPEAADITGLMFYPDGKNDTAQIQYRDRTGQLHQLCAPINEFLWLAYLLARSVKDQQLGARMQMVVKRKSGGYSQS